MADDNALVLVGHGIWGKLILRDLLALRRSVWVVESHEIHRTKAAEVLAASKYSHHTRAVATIDEIPCRRAGWVIATPAVTHEEVTLQVLQRSGPVLCEKPLTTDLPSAQRLVAAGGDRLFVGHIWCYHPGVELLASIARSGELGPVTQLRTWRANWTSPRQDVDSVWNLAPHDVSLAQFILQTSPQPVAAFAEFQQDRCVGMLGVLGTSANPSQMPRAIFEVSNRYGDKRRELRLHCRDGVAVISDTASSHVQITRSAPDGSPLVETRPFSKESALLRELSAFCDHVDGGPPPLTTAAQGLEVVAAITKLRQIAGIDRT